MPKEQEPTLVSESEYDGMSLGEAISISINDIRAGLLNVEKSLLDLVDMDEITVERYTPCYELSNELIVLSRELMMIIGEFKPKKFGFKLIFVNKKKDQSDASGNAPAQINCGLRSFCQLYCIKLYGIKKARHI